MRSETLFDSRFLSTLEQVRVVASRALPGQGRGNRLGRRRGRGLEFADYRPYAEGDDVRHIDWQAYQRLNRLLLRVYDEDQGLAIHLLLDNSRSMAEYGKFDQARRIAAAICYIGLAQFDRVWLTPFADHLATTVSTGHASGTIVRVFDTLAALEPGGGTDLTQVVLEFGRRSPRLGLVVVMSDFLDPQVERPLHLLAAMGHEVFAIHMTSQAEIDEEALVGDVSVTDAETGEQRRLDVTPAMAVEYRRAWEAHAREIASSCARGGAGYIRVIVEQPFERLILHTLRAGGLLE
jgi:uncharacterized protein (DUF58 family)